MTRPLIRLAFLSVAGLALAYAGPANAQTEMCYDGVDNDGDGRIDCADRACAYLASCMEDVENCFLPGDEDGNGKSDCADPVCARTAACMTKAEICSSGRDDDGDGLADCADPDCDGAPVCDVGRENCSNRIDDDGNGKTDCYDEACAATTACALCSVASPATPASDRIKYLSAATSPVVVPVELKLPTDFISQGGVHLQCVLKYKSKIIAGGEAFEMHRPASKGRTPFNRTQTSKVTFKVNHRYLSPSYLEKIQYECDAFACANPENCAAMAKAKSGASVKLTGPVR
ncbi:hypothetical protein [Henriciella litoralis]|uniref:hypothetical protein n=1 Tax=Henriciella litoralis TaxID=568102 RepID=UPI000A02D5BC|nr:hypothetical protein [Henriciella litoralis]